uniref:Outer capsid glycoprotein VP7 n=3 Tax=Rotavirus B (isolate RVB/Human/China/ADRV/1982) TaxID=10942 RepID=D6NGF9_ROTGA|nr:structural protein VP7 [Human rotavirus B]
MASLPLLVLAAAVNAQLNIVPSVHPEVCVLYADDHQSDANKFNGNFTQIFHSYNSITLSFMSYSSSSYDVIDIMSRYDLSSCSILAIDVFDASMDFNVFLQSTNNCSKYNANKIHYIKLPRGEEWFSYSKNLKFCPLSDSLIGMYCDTQLSDTYFEISTGGTYEVTDVPEFTQMGYTFHSSEDFYLCHRISSEAWLNYHLFYRDYDVSGVISKQINWGNVWSGFKTFAQVLYKILDLFFNSKRNVEPRA